MKKTIAGVLFMMSMPSIPAMGKDVTVQVSNINHSREGVILVMLYGRTGFPKDHSKAIATQRHLADRETLKFVFTLTQEDFAIKVLHDENGDGKVTKNWTGLLPREGLGFSNSATLRFGPPSFKRAMLKKTQTKNFIEIPMRY